MHQYLSGIAPEVGKNQEGRPTTSIASDADLHAHNLTNWQQEYDQLSDGDFYGRLDEIALDGLQIFKEHTSQALRQQCNVWPNAIWLGICAEKEDADKKDTDKKQDFRCRINGQEVENQQIMSRPGGCDFELTTPENFDIFGLVINTETLLNIANDEQIQLTELINDDHPRLLVPENTLHQVNLLLHQLLNPNTPVLHQRLQRHIILNTLLTLLKQERPVTKVRSSYLHRKRVVDKVKEWMLVNNDVPVSMTELCEMTHVSRRTLQYSFESILGVSPLKFLRTARLNQVRRALMDEHDQRPIAAIAADWGFWHPSQFAQDYTTLFGENPSKTRLKRSQNTFLNNYV